MKCVLPKCGNDLTGLRFNRKYVTCSKEHGYIHNCNQMARKRAKDKGATTFLCDTEGCHRIGIDDGNGLTKCHKCRGTNMGRKPGRSEKTAYPKGPGVRGVMHNDFRAKICAVEGFRKLCRNYSACSDNLFLDGKFKHQTNGGIDCWEAHDEIERKSYGSGLAAHISPEAR